MPIPDYQSLMLPVLNLTKNREEHAIAKLRKYLAFQLKLSGGVVATPS
jgi:restriction endonuclease Mrr